MAGRDRVGRSKTRSSEQGRKSKKKSPSKSPSKKKTKEPFSHIGLQLIPSAALAPAVPRSPDKVLKSRSPSPVANAIAFMSRIGKAAIGEISFSSAHGTPQEPDEKETHVTNVREDVYEDYDPDYEELELPRPGNNREQAVERFEPLQTDAAYSDAADPLYATVKKKRFHTVEDDDKDKDRGDSDESIYTVSDVADGGPYRTRINGADHAEWFSDLEDDQFSDAEFAPNESIGPGNYSENDRVRISLSKIGDALPPLQTSRSAQGLDESVTEQKEHLHRRNKGDMTEEEKNRQEALSEVEKLGFDDATRQFGIGSLQVETRLSEEAYKEEYPSFSNSRLIDEGFLSVKTADEVQPLVLDELFQREEVIYEEQEVPVKSGNISRAVDQEVSSASPRPMVLEDKTSMLQDLRLEQIVKQQEDMIKRLSSQLARQESEQQGFSQKQAELLQLSQAILMERDKLTSARSVRESLPLDSTTSRKDRQNERRGSHMKENMDHKPIKSKSPVHDQEQRVDRLGGRHNSHNQEDVNDQSMKINLIIPDREERTPRANATGHTELEEDSLMDSSMKRELEILRKSLENEQRKYAIQQKVIKDQQKQLLENQRKAKEASRLPSRSSTPAKTPAEKSTMPPHFDQYVLLQSRLKQMEAEREAMLQINHSLQEDNKALQELSLVIQDAGGTGSIVMQKQREEVLKENNELKAIVHRLNIELGRYQASYRAPTKEEIMDLTFQTDGPIPPWLINIKYLSPLLLAYDDKLREKNALNKSIEAQLASLKARAQEIVRENQELHVALEGRTEIEGVPQEEWVHLQEQAKLVVEENALLMRQLDLKDKRAEEVQKERGEEVSKMVKQLRVTAADRRELEIKYSDLCLKHEKLQKKLERTYAEVKSRITSQRHDDAIEEMRSECQTKVEQLNKEKEDLLGKIEALTKECRQVATKLTDESAGKMRLQTDLSTSNKTIRQLEKKIFSLEDKVEASHEKESVAANTLRQVLAVAEKAAADRDVYLEKVQSQQYALETSRKNARDLDMRIRNLKNQLKEYKNRAEKNENLISNRSRNHERELSHIREKYEAELDSFRSLVREKQRLLEQTQNDKSRLEQQLDELLLKLNANSTK